MHSTSIFLLLGAAAVVAILHSILPDHWVPLAVVARTQRWSLLRTARVSAMASAGHVITSLVLGGIIALIGLQFQREIDTQQGHIIGIVLVLTGLGFLIWDSWVVGMDIATRQEDTRTIMVSDMDIATRQENTHTTILMRMRNTTMTMLMIIPISLDR